MRIVSYLMNGLEIEENFIITKRFRGEEDCREEMEL